MPRRRSRVRPPSSAPKIRNKWVTLRININQKLLTILIAILLVILIGMLSKIMPDLRLDSNQARQFDIADSVSTEVIQGTDAINKKAPVQGTNTINSSDSVHGTESELLQLQAICTGEFIRIDADSCRGRFEEAGGALSLGEAVTFVTSVGSRSIGLEFSINSSPNPIAWPDIDAVMSRLKVGSVHSVRARRPGHVWSNQLNFQVSLQQPGEAYIVDLCANLVCASEGSLVAPINPALNGFYPLVEVVLGLARSPTEHMWIELMLNSEELFLGCLNCQAAQAAGILYLDRKEFGRTGIFYNWDIKELSAGNYSLQARLRNKIYVGPWSSEFVFEIERP